MATLADALAAYRIFAQAEGKSPKTVLWIMSGVTYFSEFMGQDGQDIEAVTGNDLRRFIIELRQRPRFLRHPYNKPQQARLAEQSIETYARAVRAFFNWLYHKDYTEIHLLQDVRPPRIPQVIVNTLSDEEIAAIMSGLDHSTMTGSRDTSILALFLDTGVRLSELVGLKTRDVHIEDQYVKVMGKGSK